MATMHMPLMGESSDDWRPVQITPLEGALYRVEGPVPPDENWKFAPGSIVAVKWEQLADGETRLVPVGEAPTTVAAIFAERYKRSAGFVPVWLGVGFLLTVLPRAPEGHVESLWIFLTGVCLLVFSVALNRWAKPASISGQSMIRAAFWGGILLCVLSPLAGR